MKTAEGQAGERVDISIVVPVLNEAGNVQRMYERVHAMFEESLPDMTWELVVTDNRSDDETFAILQSIAAADDRVRAYRFARNHGYQRSILTGYLLANGRAVVQLDADLQDPPELIPTFVDEWQRGAKVVYGIRNARRGERRTLTGARRLFYRSIDWLSDETLPRDAGDFRLVDRSVVEVLRHQYDANPYLRGAIAALGFHQVGIEYEREDRTDGETKFRFRDLVRLAVDGILSHSTRPLQLASFTAYVVVILAVLGIAGYAGGRLIFGQDWPAGFASLALLQLIGILLNAAFLGIIGAYLGRMFNHARQPPVVIIEQSVDPATSPTILTPSAPIQAVELSVPATSPTMLTPSAPIPAADPPDPQDQGAGNDH